MRSERVQSLILHGVEPLRRSALTPSFNSLEATLRIQARLLPLTEDDTSLRRPRTVIDPKASPDPRKAPQPVSPKGALKALVVVRPLRTLVCRPRGVVLVLPALRPKVHLHPLHRTLPH